MKRILSCGPCVETLTFWRFWLLLSMLQIMLHGNIGFIEVENIKKMRYHFLNKRYVTDVLRLASDRFHNSL